jgi:chromosome segregation ATPase
VSAKELDHAQRRRSAAAADLRAHEERSQEAETAAAEAEALVTAASERCEHAAAAVADVLAGIPDLDEDVESGSRTVAAAIEQSEELQELCAVFRSLTRRVGAPVVGGAEQDQLAADLDDLADRVDRVDRVDCHPLRRWAATLRDRTAALLPQAAELLAELEDADAAWRSSRQGDPSADPQVVEAESRLAEARRAADELERHARTGAMAEQARRAIETAHAQRVRLEEMGRKADQEQLAAAWAAEDAALSRVGFTSVLDYRIAMSSGSLATLVNKHRETAEQRVAEASAALQNELDAASERIADLRARREELADRAARLVGDVSGEPRETLRSLLVVPAEISELASEFDRLLTHADDQLDRSRSELDAALVGRAEADHRLAAAEEALGRLRLALANADRDRGIAAASVERALEALDGARERLSELDREVEESDARATELRGRRYSQADVEELRDALTGLVGEQALHIGDEAGPSALVLNDPLVDLECEDALAIFDTVAAMASEVPLIYVTSRPELLDRARKSSHHMTVVDSRRRRSSTRWTRRRRGQASEPVLAS